MKTVLYFSLVLVGLLALECFKEPHTKAKPCTILEGVPIDYRDLAPGTYVLHMIVGGNRADGPPGPRSSAILKKLVVEGEGGGYVWAFVRDIPDEKFKLKEVIVVEHRRW